MENWTSNLDFRLMALTLRLREGLRSPREDLSQVGLTAGQTVLDYGCGVGTYTIPAAQIVSPQGVVYALDKHPLAIEMVAKRAAQEKLVNVETIYSDLATGLAGETVDVVLLYDVLHAVPDQLALLRELGRVLKPGGILSVRPDHISREAFTKLMKQSGLYVPQGELGEAYSFGRRETVAG
jgi:ubiquinone/menaquinone biosynthesis C-methylase UbiE